MIRLVILVLALSGCVENPKEQVVSMNYISYNIVCLGGVKYYQNTRALAPVVTSNGKYFELCN